MPEDLPAKASRRAVRIGKYEVLAHIATGGMGAVYRARDTDTGREVALKVLMPTAAAQPTLLERFRREARAAAKLSHPNIVTIYDFGEEHGTPYLILEFVDGIDLHEYVEQKGALKPSEALGFVMQACRALDHAHRNGIIHRDIKPSNFLVTVLEGKNVLKLTDLGLAREVEGNECRVTREGTTVGTLDYMSPEQAQDSNDADIRSDLYSLGCTWFFLLTTRPPFPKGGLGERLLKILTEAPPDARSFNPEVCAGTAAVLGRLLAKDPADRYQTPAELLRDLDALRRGNLEILDPDPEPGLQPLDPPPAADQPPKVVHGPRTPQLVAEAQDTAVCPAPAPPPPLMAESRPRRWRRRERENRPSHPRLFVIAIVIGVVLVAGLLAFFLTLRNLPDDNAAPRNPPPYSRDRLVGSDETPREPGRLNPSVPESYLRSDDAVDLEREPDIAAHLRRRQAAGQLGSSVVLRLSGKGEYATMPIRVSGRSLVLDFGAPGPNGKPLTLRPAAGAKGDALVEVEDGDLELVGGGLRLGDGEAGQPMPWLVKVRGGNLRLSGCRLEGPQGLNYRGLISFEGASVASSKVRTCRMQRGVLISGRDGIALGGAGVRLDITQSILAVAGSGIDLQPGASVQCRLEHTTVAARGAVVHLGRADITTTAEEPSAIQTQRCAFLSPFRAEDRQAGLLLYDDNTLPVARLTWRSEDDLYDARLQFGAASRPPDRPQPLEAWLRLWGPGKIQGAVLSDKLRSALDAGLRPLQRLALPTELAPQHGADLEALGIIQ
jgi:serine/threonine protein kinase